MKKLIHWTSFCTVALIGFGLVSISTDANAQDDVVDADSEAEGEGGEEIDVPPPRPPWTGRFDLGYTWQSGRADKSELSLRGQADREVDIHSYRAVLEFLYGELEGVRNTQTLTGSFRWRADLSERVFTQSLTRYSNDRVREIRHRVEQNVGVGYRLIERETVQVSVVPGFTIQYTDEAGVDDHWGYLASLSQDLRWEINPAYRFEQDLNFLIDPADTDDHIVRFDAGVIGTLSESINLSVRYQYLYENQVRPGVEKSDQRVIASVGYVF